MSNSYEYLHPDWDADLAAKQQIADAIAHIDRDPSTLVEWPFPALASMTKPMGNGEVWFIAAASGGGKTTFVVSAIEAWRRQGKRIYVMPLELQPFRFRTYLACMETGIHPGDALSGQLRLETHRDAERQRLKDAVKAQYDDAFRKYVRISEQRAINVEGLEEGLKRAKVFGADIVIVDHIDHIEGGDKTNLYAESVRVNDAALRMAQDNDMLLLFTSQLNMDIAKGRDHLAKFGPPMQHHLMFPTAKVKNATGIIGLFRPIRAPFDGETPEEYKAAISVARAGDSDAQAALEQGVMGVTMMKLRNAGHNDGRKVMLGFERGRVVDLPERDQYTTTGGRLRKVI